MGELNVVGREGESEVEGVNFGHAQHDAGHPDGARHAQSALIKAETEIRETVNAVGDSPQAKTLKLAILDQIEEERR